MRKLENCRAPWHYLDYASDNKNITDEERQICLNKQVTAYDNCVFAMSVDNLTESQMMQCLQAQNTLMEILTFGIELSTLPDNVKEKYKDMVTKKLFG